MCESGVRAGTNTAARSETYTLAGNEFNNRTSAPRADGALATGVEGIHGLAAMDKLMKFAITVGALLAGFGVFYHYVVHLPGLEREKQQRAETEQRRKSEAQERQKLEAEYRAELRRRAYDACLDEARRNYTADWATACKAVASDKNAKLRTCLSDKTIIENRYMGVGWCRSNYGDADATPDCSLPSPRAESLNKQFRTGEERCLAEAKSGL